MADVSIVRTLTRFGNYYLATTVDKLTEEEMETVDEAIDNIMENDTNFESVIKPVALLTPKVEYEYVLEHSNYFALILVEDSHVYNVLGELIRLETIEGYITDRG